MSRTKTNSSKSSNRGAKIFAGRYAYVKPLGRGAGGAVYLAEDLLANRRQVAVKVLSAEACATVKGKMLRREFEILSKLNHPNLVRVYDYGSLGDGGIFLAEEYIDGFSLQDARALLEPAAMINITIQILQGLSYLHGMGMIHRDIKPANVMLLWLDDASALPMVKLVDFGLSSMDAPGDTLRGGTRSYMAPEVVEGEQAQLRSDLYSLGVTLYYTLCGVLPFGPRTKDDPAPTRESFRPPEPHRLNSDVPLTLSRFTMALLRQLPDVDYADAGQAFQALAADTDAFEELSAGRLANSMDVAAIPVLKGYFERGFLERRVEEDEMLVEWITQDNSGHVGRLYCILGERGIGKSCLLQDVETSCKLSGQLVIHANCSADMKPYELVVRLLQQSVEIANGRYADSMKKHELLVLVREQLTRFGLVGHDHVDASTEEAWMREAFINAMKVLDPERIVFFVDDFHLADAASLEFLKQWYREEICEFRPDLLVTAEPDNETDNFEELGGVRWLAIEGLTLDDVDGFFSKKLGIAGINPEWIEQVAGYAAGMPDYIEELCRYLIDIGILRLLSARAWEVDHDELETFQVPTGIKESFWRRMSGIGAGARECLELLALLGRPVLWESIRAMLIKGGTSFENAERILRTLQWRHLTTTDLETNGRWVYLIHEQLGSAIKDLISPEWQRALHRNIGQQLHATWQKEGGDPHEAALHLQWGGVKKEARELFEVAGDHEWEQASYMRAYECYTQARQLYDDGASLASLELKLAQLALVNFLVPACRQHLQRAVDICEKLEYDGLRFRVFVGAARIAIALGDVGWARQWYETVSKQLPVMCQQGDVLEVEAQLLSAQGQFVTAEKVLDTCISRARHFGNQNGLVSGLTRKAAIKALAGAKSEAFIMYDDALGLSAGLDKKDSLMGSLLCRYGADLRRAGRVEDGMEMLIDSLTFLQHGEQPDEWVFALLELAKCFYELGEIDKAHRRASEALYFARHLQHQWLIHAGEMLIYRISSQDSTKGPAAIDKVLEIANHWREEQDFITGQIMMALYASRVLDSLGAQEQGNDWLIYGQDKAREIGALGLIS